MKKILLVAAAALTLAGCQTERQDRAMGGALIGGGAGALIGGLATGTAGGALAGAAIGGVGGAIIGDATTPNRCRYVDRYGRTRWYRC
ncbi:MAG: lipoprotein [Rhizobiales bacterium]|nr:lipoprotein [Hyphomicrobiales bacterium]MBX3552645.1 lipoprotein [Pseudolabrys sp.]MCW5683083.1 lipoprotein [Pseudolabrys sp.]OJY43300.1 MAG: bacteriocin [Rhizobiales bacterium 64-17]